MIKVLMNIMCQIVCNWQNFALEAFNIYKRYETFWHLQITFFALTAILSENAAILPRNGMVKGTILCKILLYCFDLEIIGWRSFAVLFQSASFLWMKQKAVMHQIFFSNFLILY